MSKKLGHVKFSELVTQSNRTVRPVAGKSYPLLGVRWYGKGPFVREVVTTQSSKASRLFYVDENQFIYNRLFAWKGSFGVIGSEHVGSFVSGEFPLFDVKQDLLDVKYLNLYMCRPEIWLQIEIQSTGSTSVSRNRWKEERFKEFTIPLPPLAEQRRIVGVIQSVDNYIAALQDRVDATSIARNAILHELLNAGGDGWVETTLGEVVSLSRTRVDPSALPHDSDLVHWSIPMLDETGGPQIECASQIGSHKFVVHENAIVFSLLNPRIPRFAQIIGGANVVCSTEFAVLVPKESVLLDFLLTIVSSSGFQESILNLAKGTTKSRERINSQDLLKSSVMLPPLVEQQRIVEIVSSMDDSIRASEQTIVEAKNLRSGLLSDLLSGEHEIPESYDKLLGAA